MFDLRIPYLGRYTLGHEAYGGGGMAGAAVFQTNLKARVVRAGISRPAKDVFSFKDRFINHFGANDTEFDFGSGLVTNVGVLALAQDANWTATNALNSLFHNLKYHATGTGATAAAATDISLQTASANGGQTPVAGTQVLVSAANSQKYQTVATINYTGTEAVTEWGFFAYDSTVPTTSNLSSNLGTPATAGSATSVTVTGTPLTASSGTVMGQQMSILHDTGNATPMWGLVTSNTTSVAQVPAWYKVADGTAAGATPANTDAILWRPIMWDHKQFSAINVVNGDSIQFTYTLTINSGG
jgi:hypothetical protein